MRSKINSLLVCVLGLVTMVACSSGGGSGGAVDKSEWKLVFTWDGAEVEIPVEHMLVYLVEEEDEYPEVFEIEGDGVTLVGTFPMDSHGGY